VLVLIDNYDSFTYNLYQLLAQLGAEVRVVRNDAVSLETLKSWDVERLMVSPGPGNPNEAGISVDAIKYYAGRLPVLGVCVGHQSLAPAFGGKIVRADRIMHGKTSPIHHDARKLFGNMPAPFNATRYHSLIVDEDSISKDFEISAWTAEKEIMGLRHLPTGAEGVQFHPESILTEAGDRFLEAFLQC
jgi:anthranilate synthase/aminodeoxychorismate synthase-like glutamine amidotransferase